MPRRLNFIKTVSDKKAFTADLEDLQQSLFKTDEGSLVSVLNKEKLPKNYEVIKKLLEDSTIDINDKKAVEDFFLGLKKEIEGFKSIKVSLAFDPSDEFVARLFDWFSENVSNNCVLDIEKDEKILGGVVFINQGVYEDLSLSKKVSEYFDTRRLDVQNIPRK